MTGDDGSTGGDDAAGPSDGFRDHGDAAVAGIRSPGSNGHHPPEEDDGKGVGDGPDLPEPSFEEERTFHRGWKWGALGAAVTAGTGAFLAGLPLVLSVPLVAIPLVAAVLLSVTKLRTEVDAEGVHVSFSPAHRSPRTIPFEEVADVRSSDFDSLLGFVGWWIVRGGDARAYVVSTDRCVRIDRKTAGPVVLGSRRVGDLLAAIATGVERTDAVADHSAAGDSRSAPITGSRDDDEGAPRD